MADIAPEHDPLSSHDSQPNRLPARKPRRYAREPDGSAGGKAPSRLAQLETLLLREQGASLAELVAATGWQPHSVRGAISGALRKRGLTITSYLREGIRTYSAERAGA